MSDRWGAHTVTWWVMWTSWLCLGAMSIPRLNAWVFTALLFVVGLAWGFGKASVFKHISDEYPHNIGVISGVVGLIGGLGGFLLPIKFGVLLDLTGVRSSAFMLLFAITTVSVAWMKLSALAAKAEPVLVPAGVEA